MIYQKIGVAALCAFAIFMVAMAYRLGGVELAAPLLLAFVMLAIFGLWAARKAAAWHAANPGAPLPANPLSVIGGFKILALMTFVTTAIVVGLMVLIHARI